MTDSIRKRAVFDTNVFIAAYVARNAKSPTAELIRRWRNGEFDLLYCDGIIDEIREKFAEKEVIPFGLLNEHFPNPPEIPPDPPLVKGGTCPLRNPPIRINLVRK